MWANCEQITLSEKTVTSFPLAKAICFPLYKYLLDAVVVEYIMRSGIFDYEKLGFSNLKLSAQPYGQPNAKYVHFCTFTRYLMCT